ncbi:hypothetical protein J8J04_00955 ['Fragaria x ananassa' phyllody phytoplasma]|uniref:Uncharacterized protein n=1 Tax='Fragaria x ananassa' phyllody phytoplasma TaxID=2358428 RepID=A0ABS5K310_9MOLU|nr:hypothetical protein ['Fragaria x ananassa' phyllody phytoplasma]MBS2126271.1 hypothetical protein ['Fragaria x ananassa' phyllody phytoplasma]
MNFKIKKIFFIGIILHLFYLCFLLVLHIFNFGHFFKNKNPYQDNVVYVFSGYLNFTRKLGNYSSKKPTKKVNQKTHSLEDNTTVKNETLEKKITNITSTCSFNKPIAKVNSKQLVGEGLSINTKSGIENSDKTHSKLIQQIIFQLKSVENPEIINNKPEKPQSVTIKKEEEKTQQSNETEQTTSSKLIQVCNWVTEIFKQVVIKVATTFTNAVISLNISDNKQQSLLAQESLVVLPKNEEFQNKESQQKLTKELEEIEFIQDKIKTLMEKKLELKDDLQNDEKYKQAKETYDKIKELQQENNFEEALKLLILKQSLWEWISYTPKKTLKDAFKTILSNLKNFKQNLPNTVLSSEEKKSWWSKITNLWPSVSAQLDNNVLLQYKSEKKIPALEKFFTEHPFVARILARCLGEKLTDLPDIISFLSRKILEVTGNHVKNEVIKAKIEVPEKAKKAVREHVTKIIIASVSSATLLVTMIYWMVLKKRFSKK